MSFIRFAELESEIYKILGRLERRGYFIVFADLGDIF